MMLYGNYFANYLGGGKQWRGERPADAAADRARMAADAARASAEKARLAAEKSRLAEKKAAEALKKAEELLNGAGSGTAGGELSNQDIDAAIAAAGATI